MVDAPAPDAPAPDAPAPTPAPVAPVVNARPESLPETFWDGEKNAPKYDDIGKSLTELNTLKTERDARLAGVPKEGESYKIELPDTIKLPDGLTFQPDPKNPMFAAGQDFARKHGLDQNAFKEMVGIVANSMLADMQAGEARNAETMKTLGDGANGRVTAAKTWLDANLSKEQAGFLSGALKNANGVAALESMIAKASGVKTIGLPNGGVKTVPGAELIDKIGQNGTGRKLIEAANAANH